MPNVALANKYCLKLVPNLRALPVKEQKNYRFLAHVKKWKKCESLFSVTIGNITQQESIIQFLVTISKCAVQGISKDLFVVYPPKCYPVKSFRATIELAYTHNCMTKALCAQWVICLSTFYLWSFQPLPPPPPPRFIFVLSNACNVMSTILGSPSMFCYRNSFCPLHCMSMKDDRSVYA